MKNNDAMDSLRYFYNQKLADDLKEQLKKYHARDELIDSILDLANKYNELQIRLSKIKMLILESNFYLARNNEKKLFSDYLKLILDVAEGKR